MIKTNGKNEKEKKRQMKLKIGKGFGNVKNISKLPFRGRLRGMCTLGADFSLAVNAPEFL